MGIWGQCFRCAFSIKWSVFQQNYCISRIHLCGHATIPAGKLSGATDDNDGNTISNKKSKSLHVIHYQTKTLNVQHTFRHIALPSSHTITLSNLIEIVMRLLL